MHKFLTLLLAITISSVGWSQMHTLNKNLPCTNRTFNLYAHVILDSLGVANYTPEDLEEAIEGTNAIFANICTKFVLCGVDTIKDYEFDSLATDIEIEEIQKLYQKSNRLNVYLASELQAPPICGFAGGQIMFLKCRGSGTMIHEMGHVFGLPHTFAGDPELVDGSNCETAGDGICDTPADPYYGDPTIIWQEECEFIYLGKDANGEYYQPDVGNIMSYYSCGCGFSRQQYLIMANNIINNSMW